MINLLHILPLMVLFFLAYRANKSLTKYNRSKREFSNFVFNMIVREDVRTMNALAESERRHNETYQI